MISKEVISRILETVQIVDVVGDFVSLKRRGANFIACCPFHNEKTPSFSVSPSRGIYKCFGCGKAGNSVNFIMEHEQMTYVEALKYLGKKYGIEVQDREESSQEMEERLRHESLFVINQYAQDFFINALWNTQSGKTIGLSYLKERGLTLEIIKKFSIGWAPLHQDGSMCKAALQAGYKAEYLKSVGLAIERENGEVADRFFDRIMFPINSISGRVIAFGGRTLRSDKKVAKYINSPESEVYVKSRSLYGIFQSKASISKLQKCYLVEGYLDVISFHQMGIENVVASSGTSLTTDQIRLIKRFTNNVTILYDGDQAGIKASLRGIDMLLEEGMQIRVVSFPEGEDPDSFAQKNGTDRLKEFLDTEEQDFITFKSAALSKEAGNDPIGRARIISEVVASIAVIPDAISRAMYIESCSNQLNIQEKILAEEISKLRKKRQYGAYSPNNEDKNSVETLPKYFPELNSGETLPSFISDKYCEPAEKEILYYLIKFGESQLAILDKESNTILTVSQYILGELQNDDLELQNLIYKNIFDEYYQLRSKSQEEIQKHFLNHRDNEIVKVITSILYQEHSLSIKNLRDGIIPEESVLPVVVPKAIMVYKAKITAIAYKDLFEELKEHSNANDTEAVNKTLEQLQTLMKIRNILAHELKRLTL